MTLFARKTQASRGPLAGPEELPMVAYHAVSPHNSQYLYHVTLRQFEEHLTALREAANTPLSPGRVPAIGFDDGHRSDFEFAFPRLEEAEAKAVFFVIPGKIGTSADCLSWRQASALAAAGHSVQSHGWSHRMLTQCSNAELEREIFASKAEIEDRLGQRVTSLSVPGGRWNARVAEACSRAGYTTLFHSNPWTPARKIEGIQAHGRLMVTRKTRAADLLSFANAGRVARFAHGARDACKQAARRAMGDERYHALWCRLANFRPDDGIELGARIDRSARQL